MVGSGEGPVTALLEAFDAHLDAAHWRAAASFHDGGGAETGVEWTHVAGLIRRVAKGGDLALSRMIRLVACG
eukprot:6014825-Pyramimonas_sp.AAC.1